MVDNLNTYFNMKHKNFFRTNISKSRKGLITFLSLQASTYFYNNLYQTHFNWYMLRLLYKYDLVYKHNIHSAMLGTSRSRHHSVGYSSHFLKRRGLLGKDPKNAYSFNINFLYVTSFLKNKESISLNKDDSFVDKKAIFLNKYNTMKFDYHYDTSLVYFSWTDFFAPGLFNYSPLRFWFLFSYMPTFMKYKSNWLNRSFHDFYIIYFFSKIFTLRLHKTIPSFLFLDLKLILKERLNTVDLSSERSILYQKSLEAIFEGLVLFSHVNLHSRERDLFFSGSWLDCLHYDLFEEASRWVLPVKEEIDWSVFQGDLDDDWDSLFYLFLSESYIWPFINYSEDDFILKWKNFIKNKNLDLNRFFFLDYSLKFLHYSSEHYFKKILPTLVKDIWEDFLNGKFKHIQRTNHKYRFIKKTFLILNGWVLTGLSGKDRRVIFFRFFYLLVLKLRGFFFYWFMMVLKPHVYHLPWSRELLHIEKLFYTNQEYYKNKILITLRKDFSNYNQFFIKPLSFMHFWSFFCTNILTKLVINKRNDLEPNFVSNLEKLLTQNPYKAYLYTRKVLYKIYFAIFLDFFYYKLYYWVLMVIIFTTLNESLLDKKEYQNKISFYFFEEAGKIYKLKKQGKFSIISFYFKNIENTEKKAFKLNYTKTKLNLIINFLIIEQHKEKIELFSIWSLSVFKYSFIFYKASLLLLQNFSIILKKNINLLVNLCYEKTMDWNFGKLSRLSVQNQADLWFTNTNKKFIIPGLPQNIKLTKSNKKQGTFFKSIIGVFLLFLAKLDVVDWAFLIRSMLYYYPLSFFYIICLWIAKLLSKIALFFLTLYVSYVHLKIEFYYNISLYQEPTKKNKHLNWKKKHRRLLKNKLKTTQFLKNSVNIKLESFTFFKKVKLHLLRAKDEYRKANECFREIPQLFPFVLTGDIKPNNYFLYFYLFSLCSRYSTFLIILIFFSLHRILWIFRVNWHKWSFLYFVFNFLFSVCLVIIFFLFFSFFFMVASKKIQQFLTLGIFIFNFFTNYFLIISLCFKDRFLTFLKFLQIRSKNNFNARAYVFLYTLVYKYYYIFITWGLSKFFLNRLLWKFLETIDFILLIFYDLGLYFIYSFWIFFSKASQLLFYFITLFWFLWFGFFIFIFMLYDGIRGLYFFMYKQKEYDFIYWRAIFFYFKDEFKGSVSAFKEILFIGSLALRFMLMLGGFCLYLVYQIGWRFRIFASNRDQIKKMWAIPTKYRILRFLDLWVLYFFYRLTSFIFFNFKFLFIWICFWLYTSFIFLGSKFIYFIIYFVYWLYFFFNFKAISYNKLNKNFIMKLFKKYLYKIKIINITKYYNKKRNGIKINLLKLILLKLYIFFYNILTFKHINLYIKNFFYKIDLDIRDMQELLVFINKNYTFLTFYWATVLQISIDYGDFGWWLPYKKGSIRTSFFFLKNQWHTLFITSRKRSKHYYEFIERRFHKNHFYFFALNKVTKALLRKKSFLNDSLYMSDNNLKFNWKDKDFFFIYKAFDWLGISFIFETMHQRFKTPISQFFFSRNSLYNQNINIYLLARLQKYKDTFFHIQWHLLHLRDNTKTLVLDNFGVLWRTDYFTKFLNLQKFFDSKIKTKFLLNKNLTTSFSITKNINIKTFFKLLSYIVYLITICLFTLCFIILFLIFVCFFVFIYSWRIIYFIFNVIHFYVSLNLIFIFSSFFLFFFIFL